MSFFMRRKAILDNVKPLTLLHSFAHRASWIPINVDTDLLEHLYENE